jgi:hypothetical protein
MKRSQLMILTLTAAALCVGPALADGTNGAKKKHRTAAVHKMSSGAGSITVPIDYSKLMQLKGAPTTAVVGNPSIADVQLLEGGILFVQGRAFGTTNLIILDGAGKTVLNSTVTVVPPENGIVAVYRGGSVSNHACSPRCVRYPMPGEGQDTYSAGSASYESYVNRSMNPAK